MTKLTLSLSALVPDNNNSCLIFSFPDKKKKHDDNDSSFRSNSNWKSSKLTQFYKNSSFSRVNIFQEDKENIEDAENTMNISPACDRILVDHQVRLSNEKKLNNNFQYTRDVVITGKCSSLTYKKA